MSSERLDPDQLVFLTDGTTFIGPYIVGSFETVRGMRELKENGGALHVYAVKGSTLEEAKHTWSKAQPEMTRGRKS